MNGLNCGYTYHIRITKRDCAPESTRYDGLSGWKISPRTFYEGSHYSDTSWPDIILSPVHVRSAIGQTPAWSAVHLCEN
ncbi:hypothetical protein CEXT_617831 [Caerostris extrusa]|uniref:Uncharacterized protein n=1 Tax=Caerostris extrusa TaxID=172846 RepID=A0AAV4PN56_CAEEX|nr:hypothetical protein CEXT_617831 [Caerostris extrusa]